MEIDRRVELFRHGENGRKATVVEEQILCRAVDDRAAESEFANRAPELSCCVVPISERQMREAAEAITAFCDRQSEPVVDRPRTRPGRPASQKVWSGTVTG